MLRWARPLVFLALTVRAGALVPSTGAGTEIPVAVGQGDQLEPVVKGTTVAYTDYSSSSPHIFIWSEATRASGAVTGGSGSQVTPSLQLDRLVYTDSAFSSDVRAYGLTDQSYSTLDSSPSPQTHPAVSSRLAAWEDGRQGDLRIRVHDFLHGGGSIDITGPGTHRLPRADEDLVVYVDDSDGSAVKLWSSNGSGSVVFPGPSGSADVDALAGTVALSLPGAGGDQDIAVYGTTGQVQALLELQGDQRNPRISGDWVAFEDLSTGVSRVVLWNWRTDELLMPVVGSSEQRLGGIDWPRVVYADDRSGSFDVFLYDDSVPALPPDGGADGGSDGGCDDHCCRHHCRCGDHHHHHRRHDGRCAHHDHDRDPDDDDRCEPDRDGHDDHDCDRDLDDRGGDGGDGGSLVSCDDPDLLALAELRIQNDWRSPGADTVGFDSSTDAWAVLCIDVQRAASAWIAVNRQVAADPNDFDPKVTRVQARCRVRAGWNLLGGIVAGEPGSWLRVRVAADRRRAANVEQSDGGFGEGGQQPPAFGCTTAQAGLALPVLLLTALVLLARRSRPS